MPTRRSAWRCWAHVSPDGDTLGSTLALRLAFLALGKQVNVICDGDVPDNLKYLPGSETVLRPENVNGADYDTAIAVDVSDRSLLGKSEAVFDAAGFRMVIDHHATNPAYGQANFIRGGESACCLLAYEAILGLGVEMTKDMGTCLLTGMSTDTGHFQYPATSPATLIAAGELLKLGVDILRDDAQTVPHPADEPREADPHCLQQAAFHVRRSGRRDRF